MHSPTPKRHRPLRKKAKVLIRSRTNRRRRHSRQPETSRGKGDKFLPVALRAACSRRNRRPGSAESSLPLIFTDDTDQENCAVKVLAWFSIFGNSGDFGNFLLLLSAWTRPALGSSVQSVVQRVFPRLLIAMFSSQM